MIINQTEDPTVRVVYDTKAGKVVGYRCDKDNFKLPKYIELRQGSYSLIGKGGVVDKDAPTYVRTRVKGKIVIVPYQEMKRKSIIASCNNP